ncbi:GGDEF domain-containing protein [uncultured Desulfuromusa sp.]|uniref:GGDEF domain-containing protein n=1 Tax=uncultured Desulfuromusa sp. TaxID=219183 RepID=UPI002AA6A69C|nr:GGDEF domain-containing protein [uncultured Desulfuromusa sp.]
MFNHRSLRYKVNTSIIAIFLTGTLIFGGGLFIYEVDRRETVVHDIELELNNLSGQYGEQLGNEIFAAQVLAVRDSLADIMERHNILSITTYDEFGGLLVSSDSIAQENLSEEQIFCLNSAPITMKQKWHSHDVLTFISQIHAYGETVGFWQIQYSLDTLEKQTRVIVFIFAGLLLGLPALICFILDRFLVRRVLSPVSQLGDIMQKIQGEVEQSELIDSPRGLGGMIESFDRLAEDLNVPRSDKNEIGVLMRSFRQMLFALKNAYNRMRTDPLTGLNNRMRLDEAMKEEFNRALRYQCKFSVILMDIDHFKKVNDTWGHLVGDDVLKMMADLFKSTLRNIDIAGRWGGEEFLILLPSQGFDHAVLVAEKLRCLVEETAFLEVGTLTASFGVAEYWPEETVSDLVHKADQALYRAKELGRNRVEGFDQNF